MFHVKHDKQNTKVIEQQCIIKQLKLTQYRSFKHRSFDFSPTFNVIVGNNGAGKTSILEAIAHLGLGKSFRNCKSADIAMHGSKEWVVYAECINSVDNALHKMGWQWSQNDGVKCQINQQKQQRISAFIKQLPVQIINHENYHLIESGPQFKRAFIHWLAFHTNEQFYPLWQKYQQVLKQRNAALKHRQNVVVWNPALIESALQINVICSTLVPEIAAYASELWREFGFEGELSIEYKQGWPEKYSFEEALLSAYEGDCSYGNTQYGPHRADINIRINNMPVRHWLSRGQAKLLFSLLYLAREQLLQNKAKKASILLIDDMTAELDPEFRSIVMQALMCLQPMQVYITTQLSSQVGSALEGVEYSTTEL